MENFSFDERLFLWLNFDGGAVMDRVMSAISGVWLWIPLYLFIFWAVLRKYGWKSMLAFIVCLALAMGLSDMLCGIFKHTGLLKGLLPEQSPAARLEDTMAWSAGTSLSLRVAHHLPCGPQTRWF